MGGSVSPSPRARLGAVPAFRTRYVVASTDCVIVSMQGFTNSYQEHAVALPAGVLTTSI
jgi:hypothetical protein